MLINPIKDKLDIIVLAGQSNAEGYGLGDCDEPYIPCADILSMRDADNQGYVKNEKTYGSFSIALPRTYLIGLTEERCSTTGKIGCFAPYFGRKYASECLSPDRKLLIIHSAVGATGFAKKNWGLDDVLYKRMLRMIELSLAMNSENRLAAFLWHQGEHDAIFPGILTPEEREARHTENMRALLGDLRSRYGDVPFLAAGFTDKWSESCENHRYVLKALKNAMSEFAKTAYVDSSHLLTNSETLSNNSDAFHFSRNSLRLLGERYFDEYLKIVE